jgi:hypothetical protein
MVKHSIRTLKWDAIYQQSIFSQQAMKFISKMFLIASLMTGLTAFNFMEQFPILESPQNIFWCNTLNSTASCPTQDCISCYNVCKGIYVNFDNFNTSPINATK